MTTHPDYRAVLQECLERLSEVTETPTDMDADPWGVSTAVGRIVREVKALRGVPVEGVPTEAGWYLVSRGDSLEVVEVRRWAPDEDLWVAATVGNGESHQIGRETTGWRWLRRLDLDALAGGGR